MTVLRLLVTGSRTYADTARLHATLDALHRKHAIEVLIHGACHLGGADILAGAWAESRGVPVAAYPVDHALDGPWPGAGPRRNLRMIKSAWPTHCVAFGEGRGTDRCVDAFEKSLTMRAAVWRVG